MPYFYLSGMTHDSIDSHWFMRVADLLLHFSSWKRSRISLWKQIDSRTTVRYNIMFYDMNLRTLISGQTILLLYSYLSRFWGDKKLRTCMINRLGIELVYPRDQRRIGSNHKKKTVMHRIMHLFYYVKFIKKTYFLPLQEKDFVTECQSRDKTMCFDDIFRKETCR